ncbi:MAG: S8 family serine peptidase [Rhodoferax sp.]|nr:S8 family serine peptidase [Rhodoferax sp.]MBP7574087.1 S8 family serine peptidase [Rhodoferax sp.]
MSNLNRMAALAVATALATVSVIATAQLTPLSSKKSVLGNSLPKRPMVGEAPMNRLIVKFKDQATDKVGAFSATLAHGHIKALSVSGGMPTINAGPVELNYLKSITAQTHVALTNKKLNRAELSAIAKQLQQDPRVEYAEIDERAYPHLTINDPAFAGQQWNLKSPDVEVGGANLPAAWDRFASGMAPVNGSGVVVAVLDSGYLLHTDLTANIVLPGYDFVSADPGGATTTANDGTPRDSDASDPGDWVATATSDCPIADSSWHGTRIGGVIGAIGNNNIGMIGVAYSARILPVRVLGVCGGYVSDIAAGMRWAAGDSLPPVPNNTHAAKVINLSLGGGGVCLQTYQDAVTAVRARGAIVIASTGNDGDLSIGQPANCAGVIAVTAHTRLGDNANYANIGPGTAISAPGGGVGSNNIPGDGGAIYSTSNSGLTTPSADTYAAEAGTSFAAPHVSGVAALLYQIKPGITPDEVLSRLTNSARPHPPGTYCASGQVNSLACGTGLLDADAAVTLTLADAAPVTSASASPANPVARGATVNLSGVAAPGPNGSAIASVQWTQVPAPTVSIANANLPNASFVVPVGVTATGATFVFRFRATDMNARTTDSWVTVQANAAPTLNPISTQAVVLGGNMSFTATATDADGDAVTYAVAGLPTGATFNTSTGAFNWTNAQPAGSYTFFIAPFDGALYGVAQEVSITVVAPATSGGGSVEWMDLLALSVLALTGVMLRKRGTAQR